MQDDAALRELTAEIRRLTVLIERMRPPAKRLNRADHARAQLLVPVLAAALEERDFTTAELLRMARATLPGASELRRAIEATTGIVDAGSGKRIGKLLRRLEGVEIAGCVVACIGEESAGNVWTARPAGFPGLSTPRKPAG